MRELALRAPGYVGTQDLELLKTRKLRGAGAAPPPRATGNNKRYLILTYAAEFDRVHYPLPLLFEEVPDADALQRTIRRLREELDATKGMGYGSVLKDGPDPSDLRRLREENMDLKASERPPSL
jgi:coiled-coil domain-containing protein 61